MYPESVEESEQVQSHKPEIILLHGWDPAKYNDSCVSTQADQAWQHRGELISLLRNRFAVNFCNLPGFCGVPEPDVPFDVEDFANYLADWKSKNCPNPQFILGYSFGGAVATMYKALTGDPTPLVLVSPALARREGIESKVGSIAKHVVPTFALDEFKGWYQALMSPYYREGTPFIRKSYDTIVRRNIVSELEKLPLGSVLLIYGDNDKDTPWSLVQPTVEKLQLDHCIIVNGDHSIGQSHPNEILVAIEKFLQNE